MAGYFVCICREGNDTEKRILIRYGHLSHHDSEFCGVFVFFKKIILLSLSLQSVCSPSVQLQMDKAIPPLPALVVLEIIRNFKHDFQEIVSYRMLLEIISHKKHTRN